MEEGRRGLGEEVGHRVGAAHCPVRVGNEAVEDLAPVGARIAQAGEIDTVEKAADESLRRARCRWRERIHSRRKQHDEVAILVDVGRGAECGRVERIERLIEEFPEVLQLLRREAVRRC